MSQLVAEIVSEVTRLYPDAGPTDITNAIVEAIESESGLGDIVDSVELPTPEETLLNRLIVSRHTSPRQKMETREREELVSSLVSIRAQFASRGAQAYSLPSVSRDGAKVMLMPSLLFAVSPSTKLPMWGREMDRHLYISEARSRVVVESSALNAVALPTSAATILENVSEKVAGGQLLGLDDVGKISVALGFAEDDRVLDEILLCLERDIQLRLRDFQVDCITQLHEGESLLPKKLRPDRPQAGDVRALIDERIAAVIIHEYRRLQRIAGDSFMNGQITYGEYVKRAREYATNASQLCPKQYR